MTDKKEIIVHGVDVSECEKLAPYNGYDEETKCNPSCCQNSPNCMYKQLKRKEQECEYWKHQAELGSETTDRLAKQLQEKEQECEELKERLDCRCFDPKSNNNRCISYNRLSQDYEKDLQKLKEKEQECEKLQSQLNGNNTIIDRFLAASGKSKDITLPEEFEEVFEDIEQTYSECKELKEWQEANKATGICETCTHKTLLKNDELRRQIRELNRLKTELESENRRLDTALINVSAELQVIKGNKDILIAHSRYYKREYKKYKKKVGRYKQTLNEIEKIANIREVWGLTDTEYVENFRLHQERILDTINKAKEELNVT